jgi:hypothetical protein
VSAALQAAMAQYGQHRQKSLLELHQERQASGSSKGSSKQKSEKKDKGKDKGEKKTDKKDNTKDKGDKRPAGAPLSQAPGATTLPVVAPCHDNGCKDHCSMCVLP